MYISHTILGASGNRFPNIRSVFLSSVVLLVTTVAMLTVGPLSVIVLYGIPWCVTLFCHYPNLLVLIWPVLFFIDVIDLYGLIPSGSSIFFTPLDPAYFFTITFIAVKSFVSGKELMKILKENISLSLFVVLIGIYVILYTPSYGKSAIGEARKFYFHFIFPLLILLTVKKVADLWHLIGSIQIVSTAIAMVGFIFMLTDHALGRVLPAEAVLGLLFAAFSILIFRINGLIIFGRIIDPCLLLIMMMQIIINQHRTVFIAMVCGLCILLYLYRHNIITLFNSVMLLFAIVTVIAIVVTSVPQLGDSIIQSLRGIIDPYSDANASWRIEGWKQQLDSIFNQNFLFGAGVGGYYHWVNKGAIVRSSPHNGYIQLILKFGLLGLLMYGLLAFGFFRKTLAMRKQLPPGPLRAFVEVGIVNFGAAHGYLTGYGFSPIMLIVFALALGAVKLADSARMSPKMGRTSEAEHEHERGPCSLEFL